MAEPFQRDKSTVSRHIKNIFADLYKWRRMGFLRLAGGGSHSGAMATDDNNAAGNPHKPFA
jgi:hypothetical protein